MCREVDLEVAEVYVSFLARRAVKDKSLLDEKDLRVQDAVETWNRGIAEQPERTSQSSNAKRARFIENRDAGAEPADEADQEQSSRALDIDKNLSQDHKTNSKIKNRHIENDAQHSQGRLGNKEPRTHKKKDTSPDQSNPERQKPPKPNQRLSPSHKTDSSPARPPAERVEGQSSRNQQASAEERLEDRVSHEGEEENASEATEREKATPWSYMDTYSGYSLKAHPYIEKKKRKLQKQLELVRKSREEAQKNTGFYQPFEFEEAVKQQTKQEEVFATSIANVDKKLEEFYQKKRARQLMDRDPTLPPTLNPKPKKDLVIPKKETTDWVRELAHERRLREERLRMREERRLKKILEEDQARKQQRDTEAQQKKLIRLARVQGHLEEMAQKREVFQHVNRYQNKIIKDLISRPQVFYYVRPSDEAVQRVRRKLRPHLARQPEPQDDHFTSRLDSEFQDELAGDYRL